MSLLIFAILLAIACLYDFFVSKKPIYCILVALFYAILPTSFTVGASIAFCSFVLLSLSLLNSTRIFRTLQYTYFFPLALIIFFGITALFAPQYLNLKYLLIGFLGFFFSVLVGIYGEPKLLLAKINQLFFWFLSLWAILTASSERSGGPMESPTAFGMIIGVLWSIEFIYRQKTAASKLYLFTLAAIYVATIISTGTRMCLIVLVTTLLYAIITQQTHSQQLIKKLTHIFIFVSVAIVILYLVWIIIPESIAFKQRILEGISHKGIDLSNLGRILSWITAYKCFLMSPFYGVGLGNFSPYMKEFFPFYPTLIHCHNVYLGVLGETGILGFGLMIFVIYKMFRPLHTSKKSFTEYTHAIRIGIISMMIFGLFDNIPIYITTNILFFWLLALVFSITDKSIQTGDSP